MDPNYLAWICVVYGRLVALCSDESIDPCALQVLHMRCCLTERGSMHITSHLHALLLDRARILALHKSFTSALLDSVWNHDHHVS